MYTPMAHFSYESYVGTYRVIDYNGMKLIISDECKNAGSGEKEINKKELFTDSYNIKDIYIANQFAGIDTSNERKILDFCNEYGLPTSSLVTNEKVGYTWKGIPVTENFFSEIDPYYRNDHITLYEFTYYVYIIRNILTVISELQTQRQYPFQINPQSMFNALIPLAFFQYRMEFINNIEAPPVTDLQLLQSVIFKTAEVKPLDILEHNFFHILRHAYETFFTDSVNQIISKLSPQEIDFLINRGNSYFELIRMTVYETGKNIPELSEYFTLKEPYSFSPSEELISLMYMLAPSVLADTLSVPLTRVQQSLCLSQDRDVLFKWNFVFLIEAIYTECLFLLTSNVKEKKCANPKCFNFFSTENSRNDRKYCCTACQQKAAKVRQRDKDRIDPKRPRELPRFEGRKKKESL